MKIAICALVLVAVAGCASTPPSISPQDVPKTAPQTESITIQDGDTLTVRVFNQEALSTHEKVRRDGKLSMPVIGEVTARGKRPTQLASEIQDRLKSVVVAPTVTVTLDAEVELKVSVTGEVKNAGVFTLDHNASVLHALAAAGGLSDFADSDKVFVVRRPLPARIHFRYQDLRAGDPKSVGFALQPGDVIVVE